MVLLAEKKTSRTKKPSTPTSKAVDSLKRRAEALRQLDLSFIPNEAFEQRTAKRSILGEDFCSDFEPELQLAGTKLPSHLARLCSAPLLHVDEEKTFFCRMNYLIFRANKLRAKLSLRRPNEAKLAEIEACIREATNVKNRIVAANIRLVISIVKQLTTTPTAFEDMLSEGLLAMMRAVEKFDFDRGFRFSTYATMVIRRQLYRSMKNEHRDRSRFPNADHTLLSEHAEADGDLRIGYRGWNQLNDKLGEMLIQLDPREQLIIRARFGFDTDGKKQTLQSLAKDFGVCKERVRQLEKRAMNKLRSLADGTNLESLVDPEFATG